MLKFKHLTRKNVYNYKFIEMIEEEIELPNKEVVIRATLLHPGAAVIIPVLESGKTLLVKQYRHATHSYHLEFPAGVLEKGEEPIDTAKREIIEEVGYSALEWFSLGSIHPTPGFCNEEQFLFLATQLSPAFAPCDKDEFIEVVEVDFKALENAIINNWVTDAKTIAAYFKAKLMNVL
jgi:ADP-ribose pyrophosphatase